MTPAKHRAGHLSWLRSIAAAPEDDNVRLYFADWLEELGGTLPDAACGRCKDGSVFVEARSPTDATYCVCPACDGCGRVPNALVSRAEFIRVQCDIGVWTIGGTHEPTHTDQHLKCPACVVDDLRARERELWPLVGPTFRPADDWDAHYDPACAGPTKFALVRRGFVYTVRGPLAALLGDGRTLGALAGMGAELLAVERCEAVGVDPWVNHDSTHWGWWERTIHSGPDTLPPELMDEMDGDPHRYDRGIGVAYSAERHTPGGCILFRTEAAARDALSAAILRLARRAAGLEAGSAASPGSISHGRPAPKS